MKVSQEDRIDEVVEIVNNPSNFERVFNMNKVISIKELLQSLKRDKFCRKLAKSLQKQSDFRINHEGLLVKQICVSRNTYRVYIVPQSTLDHQDFPQQQRSSRYLKNSQHDEKMILV